MHIKYCNKTDKTTLIIGGVGGVGVNPPSWKMDTFFPVPIYRNFQSNGSKYEVANIEKNIIQFDWKFL